ncbi:hypothetical protein NitYY0826_C1755 [Nitratiruptor sp. YY08-26]|nr:MULTISPECIES: hypothetical protein [unclassified Nitratiruptor]BCD62869.1 hypothetical protein NitYY0813_C1753 [Nitratiruptor sp. YY08-13]BCD66805.1 hypothetical protein NitYY0826_C1755 [Nitratiruptor sp. YY08-26]
MDIIDDLEKRYTAIEKELEALQKKMLVMGNDFSNRCKEGVMI